MRLVAIRYAPCHQTRLYSSSLKKLGPFGVSYIPQRGAPISHQLLVGGVGLSLYLSSWSIFPALAPTTPAHSHFPCSRRWLEFGVSIFLSSWKAFHTPHMTPNSKSYARWAYVLRRSLFFFLSSCSIFHLLNSSQMPIIDHIIGRRAGEGTLVLLQQCLFKILFHEKLARHLCIGSDPCELWKGLPNVEVDRSMPAI